MGADFLFAAMPRCRKPESLLSAIDRMPTSDMGPAFEFMQLEPTEADVAVLREELRRAAKIVIDPRRRDVGLFQTEEGRQYVISGGMSWGDDPTDACHLLWLLQESGLEYE